MPESSAAPPGFPRTVGIWEGVHHAWANGGAALLRLAFVDLSGASVPAVRLAVRVAGRWLHGRDLSWLTRDFGAPRRGGEQVLVRLPAGPVTTLAWRDALLPPQAIEVYAPLATRIEHPWGEVVEVVLAGGR